jgi:hypothetical protein
MKNIINIFCILCLLSGGYKSKAQENIAHLLYKPVSPNPNGSSFSLLRTTALSLPFFEDFNQPGADPDTSKWIGRQVYINNTMGVNVLSQGVATFDALSQYGIPYDPVTAAALLYADSLTSKQIDLSSFVPGDSIYLSFFYQPGGNGFTPERQDSLMLYFKPKTGAGWRKVWSKSDTLLQNFRQVMIPVSDTLYLHSGFQFRFVNKASTGINDDVWNIDYIRINTGRNKFDTAVNDIAYTRTPSSILKDYTAMPYRQYLAAASAERATDFNSNIRNNFSSAQNVTQFGYEATQAGTGTSLGSGSDVNRNIPAYSTSDVTFNTYGTTPSAGTYEKVIFESKYYLESPAADANKSNDTITGQQVFDNYLAYDDGTAEMSYYLNLFPTLPGKIAIEHHLNQPDTLRGLAIYFGRQVPLATYKYFSIVVYKNIAYGSSSSDNIIYQIENLQPGYVDTVNHFWIYKFDKPVPMPSGTFYIGTTQPALSGSDSLYIGLDRNRTAGNHAYYNVLNVWSSSLVSGALMMRPILGEAIRGTKVTEFAPTVKLPDIYPNPARDILNVNCADIAGPLSFSVKNILGINVLNGTIFASDPAIDVHTLPVGAYTIELQAEGRQYQAQQFIKQ